MKRLSFVGSVVLCASLVVGARCLQAGENKDVLRFVPPEKWTVGNEANATASIGYEYDATLQTDVMKIDYAFSPVKGKQNQFIIKPGVEPETFAHVDAVRLWFKGNGSRTRASIHLLDGSGETFANRKDIRLADDRWTSAVVSFSKESTPHCWGGNKDGVMDPPVTIGSIMIMGDSGGDGPAVAVGAPVYFCGLDVIGRTTDAPSGDMEDGAFVGNLAMPSAKGDGLEVEIAEVGRFRPVTPTEAAGTRPCVLTNLSDRERIVAVSMRHRRLLSCFDRRETFDVTLAPGAKKTFDLPLDFAVPGVHEVEVGVSENGRKILKAGTVANIWEPVGNDWKDEPETFFGCMESLDTMSAHMDDDLATMRNAGVKIVRFIVRWHSVEKEKGAFAWDTYDRIFEACKRHNIIPYPILARAPKWAVDPKILASAPDRTMDWLPNIDAYARFVAEAVTRYKGYTRYWQIWNEPYAQHYFWGGSAESYAKLMKAAFVAVKNADPEARVNTGTVYHQGDYDKTFLAHVDGHFDNWPFHCHDKVGSLHASIARVKALLGKEYRAERVWNDETGYPVDPKLPGAELEKAAVVSQKLIVCRAEGLGNHTWFIFRHAPQSSLDPRDNFPALDHLGRIRPVVLAHNAAARGLKQTRKLADYNLGELGSAYLFERPGENVLVAFAGDLTLGQVMTVSFDKPVNAVLYDMLGSARDLRIDKDYTLPLEFNPVYLVLQDNAAPRSVTVHRIAQTP